MAGGVINFYLKLMIGPEHTFKNVRIDSRIELLQRSHDRHKFSEKSLSQIALLVLRQQLHFVTNFL